MTTADSATCWRSGDIRKLFAAAKSLEAYKFIKHMALEHACGALVAAGQNGSEAIIQITGVDRPEDRCNLFDDLSSWADHGMIGYVLEGTMYLRMPVTAYHRHFGPSAPCVP